MNYFRKGGTVLEILIIVSPRSSAESRAVCDGLAAEDERIRVFVQRNNPGVGHAFREGYARVRGNVVLSMDSDNEMDHGLPPLQTATRYQC